MVHIDLINFWLILLFRSFNTSHMHRSAHWSRFRFVACLKIIPTHIPLCILTHISHRPIDIISRVNPHFSISSLNTHPSCTQWPVRKCRTSETKMPLKPPTSAAIPGMGQNWWNMVELWPQNWYKNGGFWAILNQVHKVSNNVLKCDIYIYMPKHVRHWIPGHSIIKQY